MKSNKKQIATVGAVVGVGALVAGGLAGAAINEMTTEPVVKTVFVDKEVIKEVPVNVTVEKEVIVEVPVEVQVEDEAFLKAVCDRALFDDLSECREEITAEDEAIALAIAEIKAELGDELEDADIVDDEDEVELIKVYDDLSDEEINVVKSDFDDEEYEFEIKVKVDDEDADEKKYAIFTVEVEDGEAKIVDVKEE